MPLRCMVVAALPATVVGAVEPEGAPWRCYVVDDSSRGADGVKLADINGDGLLDVTTGWEEGGVTRVYLNPGAEHARSRWPSVTVGVTPSAEDAVFADLDGDGRSDVVSCCEGSTRSIYVHWSPREHEALLAEGAWERELLADSDANAQKWMFAWPMQVDGVNGVDLVAGSKGKAAQVGWFEAASEARELQRYRWRPISPVGWVMSIWKRDMDGDEDVDLVVSDRTGALRGCRWLENPGVGPQQKSPWKSHRMGAESEEAMSMALGDLDGDGLEDAVVAVNDKKLVFLKRLDETGARWQSREILTDCGAGSTRAVAIADIDGDGRLDLAVTTSDAEGQHGVFWLRRESKGWSWKAYQVSGAARGIKYDRIEMIDLDGDGDPDLLTSEEREGGSGMGVVWYENPRTRPRSAVAAAAGSP